MMTVCAPRLYAQAPALTIDDIVIGDVVNGEPLSIADLRGKVVIVEMWGTQCEPCLAEVPVLRVLYNAHCREFREDSLVILAMHQQTLERAVLRRFLWQQVAPYPVTTGGTVLGYDKAVAGIPLTYVFDAAGQCVFTGRLSDAGASIETSLRQAPDAVAGSVETFTDTSIAALYRRAVQRNANGERELLGQVCGELRTYAEDLNAGERSEQARVLLQRIEAYAQRHRDRAAALAAVNPVLAARACRTLAALFQGDALGSAAAREETRITREDRLGYLRQLNAWNLVEMAESKWLLYTATHSPRDRQAAGQLCAQVMDKYPNTAGAARALEWCRQMDLPVVSTPGEAAPETPAAGNGEGAVEPRE